MAVSDQQLQALGSFIAGAKPDERGEVEMFCPLHNDTRRSASLNIHKGAWYCHAGCGGGSVERLIDAEDTWVSLAGRDREVEVGSSPSRPAVTQAPNGFRPTPAYVRKWHNALMANDEALKLLYRLRGIEAYTASRARIGWHETRQVFTIPIFGPDWEILNVRYYHPSPGPERRKIWSVKGMGAPRLYPINILRRSMPGDAILFCEGEWDALMGIQSGALAVTRTGSAKVWRHAWTPLFAGRRVYLCHDADRPGVEGNELVGRALKPVAQEVRFCRLPYPIEPKHGKDLTDCILEYGPEAVWDLMAHATPQQ